MKSISEILRVETLAASSPRTSGVTPQTLGIKSTPVHPRASLYELESAYINDPTIYNGINKIVSVIMASGYEITGNSKSVKYIEDFLSSVGTTGGHTDWDRLLETNFRHQAVYGRAFNEIIYDVGKTNILDLDFIDPKQMDYPKNANGLIVVDNYSNPVGWVQSVPLIENIGGSPYRSDVAPDNVRLGPNQIFFSPEKIAHFKMSEIGEGFYGVGLVEPILQTSNRKLVMMKALAEFFIRTGFPIKIYEVGDPSHEPTEELLRRTVEELEKTSYQSSFALPYYVKSKMMEPQKLDKLNDYFKGFIEEEVTTLGPKAFVTGLGEQTNKATLSRQEFLYKLTMKDMISNTTKIIEKEIFARISALNNLPDVPKIVWGEINLEELDSKAERIVKYAQSGIITPDDNLEKMVRKFEGLPESSGGGVRNEKKDESTESNK